MMIKSLDFSSSEVVKSSENGGKLKITQSWAQGS